MTTIRRGKFRPIRKATARDRRRSANYFTGGPCCLAEHDGWECSLKKRHLGNHEAWACDDTTDSADDLCHEWPKETA